MTESLYSSRSNLILGFHGCDQSLVDKVVAGKVELNASNNDYDWLGSGIYFWENNEERALEWAKELSKRTHTKVFKPAVIGAVIDLGFCLDLTDNHYLMELRESYNALKKLFSKSHRPLPKNMKVGQSDDLLLRKLDCAVIENCHSIHRMADDKPYDSVRGVFWEGKDLYPNAGFKEKNHIQICVRNPNCIKGFFLPRFINPDYGNP
jgi:hypothetical protein